MEAIYPISALAKDQKTVKQAAREGLVRITEHGSAAFVFCSEEILEQRINEAVEEALFQARLQATIAQGRDDIASGRYIEGTENARREIEHRIARRG